MLGERLARRPLASESGDALRLGCGHLGGDLVLGGAGLQLLQLQLELIKQATRALGVRAIQLPLQLGDLQLQMGDLRLIVRGLGAGDSQLRLGDIGARLGGRQGRPQRVDLLRRRRSTPIHDQRES